MNWPWVVLILGLYWPIMALLVVLAITTSGKGSS